MPLPEPEFVRLQRAFTRHLRDPENVPPPPGHETRRLDIYRHAIYANVAGLMADNYPRIRAIFDDAEWTALIRHYLVNHASRASAFVQVPREFLDYLAHERNVTDDPPFLYELAHFDWLETLVGADQRRYDERPFDPEGDLIAGVPVANPIMCLETYRFPVHAIDMDYQPAIAPAEATRIAAFRDTDLRYGFLDLNAPSARLLELVMADSGRTGAELIAQTAADIAHPEPARLLGPGRDILERMRSRGAVLGTRPASPAG